MVSTQAKALTLLNLSAVLGDIDHDEHGLRWGLEAWPCLALLCEILKLAFWRLEALGLMYNVFSNVELPEMVQETRSVSSVAWLARARKTGLLSGPGLPQCGATGCEAGALGRSAGVHRFVCTAPPEHDNTWIAE